MSINCVTATGVLSFPDHLLRPRLWGVFPEGGIFVKTEREEDGRTEVKTSRGDVSFAHARLVAINADAQPAVFVEHVFGSHCSTQDGGEGAADLCG